MTMYVAAGAVETATTVGVESPFVQHLHNVSPLAAFDVYKQQSRSILNVQLGDHILDVGCGDSDDTRALARLTGPTGRIVGVDSDSVIIAAARRRAVGMNLPIEYHVGDVLRLPFDRDSFDLARADRMFQCLADPGSALDELIRVTRTHGRIVVGDVDWETLTIDARDRGVTRKILQLAGDRYASSWIGRQLPRIFRGAGLRDIAVAPVTLTVTDYAIADYLFGLGMAADEAQHTGIISEAEAAGWLEDLDDASRTGHFFSSLTGFIVRGRKC